jgi:hypothetical protein
LFCRAVFDVQQVEDICITKEAPMNAGLISTYQYLASDEGVIGIMTVTVLMLGCGAMITCMIAYPEVIEALRLGG